MELKTKLIVFTIDNQLLAIPISGVERIVRAVEVTPLRKAPAVFLGMIDYHGAVMPVLSLRKRLGFPERSLTSSDRFMIVQTSSRKVAVVVDEINQVISPDANIVPDPEMLQEAMDTEGITRCKDGLILIYNPEKFLSSTETFDLEKALKSVDRKELPNG